MRMSQRWFFGWLAEQRDSAATVHHGDDRDVRGVPAFLLQRSYVENFEKK